MCLFLRRINVRNAPVLLIRQPCGLALRASVSRLHSCAGVLRANRCVFITVRLNFTCECGYFWTTVIALVCAALLRFFFLLCFVFLLASFVPLCARTSVFEKTHSIDLGPETGFGVRRHFVSLRHHCFSLLLAEIGSNFLLSSVRNVNWLVLRLWKLKNSHLLDLFHGESQKIQFFVSLFF